MHGTKNPKTYELIFFFVRKKNTTTWNLCNVNITSLIIKYVLEITGCNLNQVFIKLFYILILSLLVISYQIFRSYVMLHRISERVKSFTQTVTCYDSWEWNCQYSNQSHMLDLSIRIQKERLAITGNYVRGRVVLVPNCSNHSSPSGLHLMLMKSSSRWFVWVDPSYHT